MHPLTAGHDWRLDEIVYDDGRSGIAVALFTRHTGSELALGFRWIYDGDVQVLAGLEWRTPYFGKSSEWVLLPNDFAVPAAMSLIAKHAAGMRKINEAGMKKMVSWLASQEAIVPAFGY